MNRILAPMKLAPRKRGCLAQLVASFDYESSNGWLHPQSCLALWLRSVTKIFLYPLILEKWKEVGICIGKLHFKEVAMEQCGKDC